MAEHSLLRPRILYPTPSLDVCEDDCACPAYPVARLTESFSEAAVWQASSSLRRAALPDSHTLVFNPSGPQSVAILNSPAHEVLAGFRTPLRLTQATQILPKLQPQTVLSTARELASIGLLVPVENLQSTVCNQQSETLVAWLHLTDRCNLCCDYCYLPHIQEDMSSETGRVTVDATFRSAEKHGFQQIKLKYSGGEPLLRFPLVIELHQYAQALAEQYGLSLDGVVLSNGTLLTTEIVEALKTAGIRLMISLDGQGDYHDRHRRYASGRGSSADVAESIELALAHGLMPNISITISPRTVDGLPEVIAWVLERDLPFNLNFYRENEHSVSHADMRLDEERIINGMLAAYKVIEANLPRHSLLPSLVDRANLASPHLRTCGIGENYLVFDSRGRVSKCQMKMDKPVADVSTPDPLSVVRADQLGVQNISVEEKEPCRDCQWRYWCTGGCPLETYRVTGRYDVKSPNCTIYQALFPEVLRLEGLRLLKYQDDPQVVQKIVL